MMKMGMEAGTLLGIKAAAPEERSLWTMEGCFGYANVRIALMRAT